MTLFEIRRESLARTLIKSRYSLIRNSKLTRFGGKQFNSLEYFVIERKAKRCNNSRTTNFDSLLKSAFL